MWHGRPGAGEQYGEGQLGPYGQDGPFPSRLRTSLQSHLKQYPPPHQGRPSGAAAGAGQLAPLLSWQRPPWQFVQYPPMPRIVG